MSKIFLFNTLTRKKEEFVPVNPPNVGIYSCGPTVYWNQHIGHMYAYVQWDVLVRFLKSVGYNVKWVMNITDVGHMTSDEDAGEDKMEKGAKRENLSVWQIADKYINQFLESVDKLNIKKPDVLCRATEHIGDQIDLIKKIEARGFTYKTSTGVVFDTAKFSDYSQFARAAKKIYVDIDPHELNKFPISPDISIQADAREFINELIIAIDSSYVPQDIDVWKERCHEWRDKYPVNLPEYGLQNSPVNIFNFISVLGDELADDELIIPTASGSGFTSSHQALKIKPGQRCFTSNGFAEMGFDLPGAIGACIGANKKRVVTVTGDGGVQMNIQELQTIVHHALPIKLFILNNNGYLTIRHTENALFNGIESGTGPETGVSIPNIQKLGKAYGFKTFEITEHHHMVEIIRKVLEESGPVICEVVMDPMQPLVPKTSFKQLPDGRMISPPLEDLYPFLDREEFMSNMIIPVIDSDEQPVI